MRSSRSPVFSIIVAVFLAWPTAVPSPAQEQEYLAILPPFHDRLGVPGVESSVALDHQRFLIALYRNAVAVYADADFSNQGPEPVEQEFALPSTGHDDNGPLPGGHISNGILSVQLWIEGERVEPELMRDGDEEWYTIRTRLLPGQSRRVSALFWAQTSLTDVDSLPGLDSIRIPDGDRGFMVDLAHAASWKGSVQSIEVEVITHEGLDPGAESFAAEPDRYEIADSTLFWKFYDLEPSSAENISVRYRSSDARAPEFATMAQLAAFITHAVYDNLLATARVRNNDN